MGLSSRLVISPFAICPATSTDLEERTKALTSISTKAYVKILALSYPNTSVLPPESTASQRKKKIKICITLRSLQRIKLRRYANSWVREMLKIFKYFLITLVEIHDDG
jgi:hypothetical protein